jgi:hypothetical protein
LWNSPIPGASSSKQIATGAILRLTMEADLTGDLPIVRPQVLVEYGPVDIAGQPYICPVKSIAVWRSRTVSQLAHDNVRQLIQCPDCRLRTQNASISELAPYATVDIWSHGSSRDPADFPLFHPQRLGRVDGGGPARGNPSGEQRNHDKHGQRTIMRSDLCQICFAECFVFLRSTESF